MLVWTQIILTPKIVCVTPCYVVAHSSVVVKALCYKPEGSGLIPDEVNVFFSIYLILLATLDPGVYSASNRNE
jgi:hypothetical protein